MLLLEITDPISTTVKLSKAVTEQGISNVLSGLMILTFIAMGGFLLKTLYNILNKVSEAIQQLIDQNMKILTFVSALDEDNNKKLLIAQTKWNTESILDWSFEKSINELMTGLIEILTMNHIDDKDFTQNRVRALVSRVHYGRVKSLNTMIFNGVRIGEIADNPEWVEKSILIMLEFIYSAKKEDLNKDVVFRDLKLAYKDFLNELKLD